MSSNGAHINYCANNNTLRDTVRDLGSLLFDLLLRNKSKIFAMVGFFHRYCFSVRLTLHNSISRLDLIPSDYKESLTNKNTHWMFKI